MQVVTVAASSGGGDGEVCEMMFGDVNLAKKEMKKMKQRKRKKAVCVCRFV